MRSLIIGASALALGGSALAQMPTTTPTVPAPAVVAAPATPAEQAAATQRSAEAEKAAQKEREASEKRAKEQERQAEKEREAAEKRAKDAERAAEKQAAADAAVAEKAAAANAAAAASAAAVAKSGDARDIATQVCLAEAKSRAVAVGATNVTMNEVKDTDKKSDGRASVTARVNVITTDKNGKIKVQKKTIKCSTRNGVVTAFKWD